MWLYTSEQLKGLVTPERNRTTRPLREYEMMTNPNGANGTTSDPREQTCWDFYVESLVGDKGNAYESAIKAGYSEDHSRNITIQGWFKERLSKLRRKDMLSKAERNLDKILDLKTDDEGKENPQLLKIKTDVSVTIAKTLGKESYSERSELTGKDGKDLPTPILHHVFSNNSITEDSKSEEEN